MKDLEYYKEIKALLRNLLNNEDPYKGLNGSYSNWEAFSKRTFGLETRDTDFVCRIVLFNYYKLGVISNSKNIDNHEKFLIISSFVSESFKGIVNAINSAMEDYNQKARFASSMSCFDLKWEISKILERNIELILILDSFKVTIEVENYLINEGQKIFELAESLDIKIRSREDNLKYYLSRNLDSLSKIDSDGSIFCYHWFDNTFSLLDCTDSAVDHARKELKYISKWKLFRSKVKKESDLKNATQRFNKELEKLQKRRNSAKSELTKEIKQIENEIDKLKSFSPSKNLDFAENNISNSSFVSLKNLAATRIRQFLDERLKTIEGPFDLYNITLMRNELVSTIESYRQQFKENKNGLQLSDRQIETMFDELINEIHNEYFK